MTDNTTTETDDVSGLKANNADLKTRLDKAQKANRDLEARIAEIEEAQNDALDTTKTEAEKAQAKLQRQIDKLSNDLAARDTRLGELLIDNAIKDAITSNNVDPRLAKGAEAILRSGAKVVNGEAVGADGQPLTEAIAAFFGSPEANAYVAAAQNTGAGAQGSTVVHTNHGFTSENIRTPVKEAEWMALQKTDPDLFRKVAVDTGMTDFQ